MRIQRAVAVAGVAAAMAAVVLMAALPAAGGGATKTLSLNVATFAAHHETTHFDDHCKLTNFSPSGMEVNGTVDGIGGYIGGINLPHGQLMTSFSLTVGDNDSESDIYAYLLRKRLNPGPVGSFLGYKVLAFAQSTGSSANLRRFTDASLLNPDVDTPKYSYFAEVINCAHTTTHIGIQVTYRRP